MDKQHSDHIEHRFRQAAENINPPFNEEGWKKMEVLLDQEFNKKRRRRGFLWWWYGLFICLVIAGGIFYYFNIGSETNTKNDLTRKTKTIERQNPDEIEKSDRPGGQKNTSAADINSPKKATSSANAIVDQNRQNNDKKVSSFNSQKKLIPAKTSDGQIFNGRAKTLNPGTKKNNGKVSARFSGHPSSFNQAYPDNGSLRRKGADIREADRNAPAQKEVSAEEKNKQNDYPVKTPDPKIQQQANIITDSTAIPEKLLKKESASNPDSVANIKKPVKSAKSNSTDNIAPRGLYILASIASDGSNVKNFTLDNRKAVYGGGLGYRFNNRISLQAGFYAGRKIYTAGPTDYKAKPNSYISRYKIMRIEADCMIYELPLSFRYDMLARKNFRAYATGGLSSFIMKSENYIYHLTGNMGGYLLKDTTIRSNKNFFSSAALSIGFEQKLFKSFYIQAEPYIRVPISGVGEGKVKLYSAGLQVGLKYQVLKKKKKS